MESHRPLELWGGIECTFNRVGDAYYDQIRLSGHADRPDDWRQIAELGFKAIRYPVLWEQVDEAGGEPAGMNWERSDRGLDRLRSSGIRPIVGLVHHGSGPRSTSLVSSDFPAGLALFARRVAERYPWVQSYTPVNEPLTTARFSCLYGHWYPHERSDRAFVTALLNQCRAIVEAMKAIREINPKAKLIQTENLEKVYGTPALKYQVDFENQRRWLSLDLLTGTVDARHPLRSYLTYAGATDAEIDWFQENRCPPDVVGWNYYLTSERFLDERIRRYPSAVPGGNGRQAYVDVEAVRVRAEGIAGWGALLREAWHRYHRPLAMTEVHVGCHRESQLLWMLEAWREAQSLRADGIDVRAVTAWSLFGAFDWNSLCTVNDHVYESGVFDVRSGKPRPTALVGLLRQLSIGAGYRHPGLPEKPWWNAKRRLLFPAVRTERAGVGKPMSSTWSKPRARPIMITGAEGALGRAMIRACRSRGISFQLLPCELLAATSREALERTIVDDRPWAIIHAAGYDRVDQAEVEVEKCRRLNTLQPTSLAELCGRLDIRLLTFSSDLVFDGMGSAPYLESDEPHPLNVFGKSKADAEREVLAQNDQALVVRCGPLFTPWHPEDSLVRALQSIEAGRSLRAADDWIVSPTYIPMLAHVCLDVLFDREHGLRHLSNVGVVSWAEFLRQTAALIGLDPRGVVGCAGRELQRAAPRPGYSPLSTTCGAMLPKLSQSLEHFCDAWKKLRHSGMNATLEYQGST